MKHFVIRNSWWFVSMIAIILLILNTFKIGDIKIDNVSLTLLVIILISPFISQIRKIKMGDFEAEIDPKEIQKVKDDVESNIPVNKEDNISTFQNEVSENILSLVETDHILALAKLRIELEKAIYKLYTITVSNSDNQNKNPPLMKLVHELVYKEIFPTDTAVPLREVISLCNRAVHGQEVKKENAKSIVDIGLSLFKYIHVISSEYAIKPNESIIITKSLLDEYLQAKYEVTTAVPLVNEPFINKRIVNQSGLDELMNNYNEYGEFIVEVKQIKNN